jgi:hypothetical protein
MQLWMIWIDLSPDVFRFDEQIQRKILAILWMCPIYVSTTTVKRNVLVCAIALCTITYLHYQTMHQIRL